MTEEYDHLKKIFFEGMKVQDPLDGAGIVLYTCERTGAVQVRYAQRKVTHFEGHFLTVGDQEHSIFLISPDEHAEVLQPDWLERVGFKTIRARGFFAGRHVRNYVITCPAVMSLHLALELTAKRQSEYIGHEIVLQYP